jgi:hypothetical protein
MPVKNSRSDDGQPFSRIDFFTEMGKFRDKTGTQSDQGFHRPVLLFHRKGIRASRRPLP